MKEVRELLDSDAAWIARMSHSKSEKLKGRLKEMESRNKILDLLKLAAIFALPLFVSNLFYNECIMNTSPAMTNMISSSSVIFTLILSSVFKSSNADKLSPGKVLAAKFLVIGNVLAALFAKNGDVKSGNKEKALSWGLISAISGAIYTVFSSKQFRAERRLPVPLFDLV